MKVAQNKETNPDSRPVRPPHIPSIANTQLSPSGSSVRKHETPGILSRMFFPLRRYHLIPREGTPNTLFALSRIVMLMLHCIYCFFPLFSSVDYEADAAADTPIDYGVDDPSFLSEQPGKPPPP